MASVDVAAPRTTEGLAAPDLELRQARRDGLRWLGQLRWWVIAGGLGSVLLALGLGWTFVDTPKVVGGLVFLAVANAALSVRASRAVDVGDNELSLHATVDLLVLTWLLAWAGGLKNPIAVAYSFHVVLGALLSGRRGAIRATLLSLISLLLLALLERTGRLPSTPLEDAPPALWLLSLGMLMAGLGYLSLVVAERQAQVNARVREKQLEAERGVALLLGSLEALGIGLDLVGADGRSQLQNDTARKLKGFPAAREAADALEHQTGTGAVSRRFAVPTGTGAGSSSSPVVSPAQAAEGQQRIVDLVALPPSGTMAARALLYVDRTDELVVEQRHVMLERLATLGRALQGVAHELNTPLTTMQTLAKDMKAALDGADLDPRTRSDVAESLTLLIDESQRCRSLTQTLLSSANDGQRRGTPNQSVLEVVRRAVRLVGPAADAEGVFVDERSLDRPAPKDPDRLLQIVMNLVQNALRATVDKRGDGKGPRVSLSASESADAVTLRIQDRGPGLPAEVKRRLFEPFVTTRPMGEGTGLGLYTSQLIARELGGSLSLDDAPGGGTVATLTLPKR